MMRVCMPQWRRWENSFCFLLLLCRSYCCRLPLKNMRRENRPLKNCCLPRQGLLCCPRSYSWLTALCRSWSFRCCAVRARIFCHRPLFMALWDLFSSLQHVLYVCELFYFRKTYADINDAAGDFRCPDRRHYSLSPFVL